MPEQTTLSVSIQEAVKLTHIGRSSIYAAIKSGALPIRKVGRRTNIETHALRQYIEGLPSSLGGV